MSGYASVAIASVVIPIKHGEELWGVLGTGTPNPNYPLFTFAFNLRLKLGIGYVGTGNAIILATFPYTAESIWQYCGRRSAILPIRCWSWVKIGVDMGVRTVCIGCKNSGLWV